VSATLTVASGFIALVADVVAGYYSVIAADLYDQAAGALTGTGSESSKALVKTADEVYTKMLVAVTVRSVNNAVTLSVMATAFAIILYCSVMIFASVEKFGSKTLLRMQTVSEERVTTGFVSDVMRSAVSVAVRNTVDSAIEQRRHLTWANALILTTFPPCLIYYLLFAYANFNQVCILQFFHIESAVLFCFTIEKVQSDCGSMCDACQPEQFLIRKWMDATPEFWTLGCSLCSPITMALCICIVSRAHHRALSIYADVQKLGVHFGQRS
jgi:hypothetical protein